MGHLNENIMVRKMRLEHSPTLPNLQALAASNVSHLDVVYNNDLLYNHILMKCTLYGLHYKLSLHAAVNIDQC